MSLKELDAKKDGFPDSERNKKLLFLVAVITEMQAAGNELCCCREVTGGAPTTCTNCYVCAAEKASLVDDTRVAVKMQVMQLQVKECANAITGNVSCGCVVEPKSGRRFCWTCDWKLMAGKGPYWKCMKTVQNVQYGEELKTEEEYHVPDGRFRPNNSRNLFVLSLLVSMGRAEMKVSMVMVIRVDCKDWISMKHLVAVGIEVLPHRNSANIEGAPRCGQLGETRNVGEECEGSFEKSY
ncbi:hypothetical protein C5167_004146 [Papaver somniferum]|nr:hypothetical protein C5167_004146 [Papaver somniferum]